MKRKIKNDIDKTIDQIIKEFGKGSVFKLDEDRPIVEIDSIPTGSMSLDEATGIGGFPIGRIIEVYGPESHGKTTMALHAIVEAQKKFKDKFAAFVDVEHALDPVYARNIGIKSKKLLVSQPDSGEQALDIVETLVKSEKFSIVVVDSVAALVPKAELEGEMGDQQIGLQARLMSKALRKLTGIVSKSNTCVLFINQIREKIGILWGNPETTTGGRALKFYASMRLDVRRRKQYEDYILCNVKVVKNKVAPPFKVAEVIIVYGKGIDKMKDIIDIGMKHEVIKRSGAFYKMPKKISEDKIQGEKKLRKWLSSNEEKANRLKRLIIKKMREDQK